MELKEAIQILKIKREVENLVRKEQDALTKKFVQAADIIVDYFETDNRVKNEK